MEPCPQQAALTPASTACPMGSQTPIASSGNCTRGSNSCCGSSALPTRRSCWPPFQVGVCCLRNAACCPRLLSQEKPPAHHRKVGVSRLSNSSHRPSICTDSHTRWRCWSTTPGGCVLPQQASLLHQVAIPGGLLASQVRQTSLDSIAGLASLGQRPLSQVSACTRVQVHTTGPSGQGWQLLFTAGSIPDCVQDAAHHSCRLRCSAPDRVATRADACSCLRMCCVPMYVVHA